MNVASNIWVASHSEKYFHTPHDFIPERYLPTDHPLYDPVFDNDDKSASNPWSVGPRNCIGLNLAYMEMRIILARVVWEFDLELVTKDLDWKRESLHKGVWVRPDMYVRFRPVSR